MTIKELKDKISQLPNNMEVFLFSVDDSDVRPLTYIEIYRIKDRNIMYRPSKETAGAKKSLLLD